MQKLKDVMLPPTVCIKSRYHAGSWEDFASDASDAMLSSFGFRSDGTCGMKQKPNVEELSVFRGSVSKFRALIKNFISSFRFANFHSVPHSLPIPYLPHSVPHSLPIPYLFLTYSVPPSVPIPYVPFNHGFNSFRHRFALPLVQVILNSPYVLIARSKHS